jgi:hypothetical protein
MNAVGRISVVGTTFRNNTNWAVHAAGGGDVSVGDSRILGGGYGVIAEAATGYATLVTVSDSFLSGLALGAHAYGYGGHARLTLTRSTIDRAEQAFVATAENSGTAIAAISGSVISNSQWAYEQNGTGSEVRSLGNNHFENNVQTFGTLTTVAPR